MYIHLNTLKANRISNVEKLLSEIFSKLKIIHVSDIFTYYIFNDITIMSYNSNVL